MKAQAFTNLDDIERIKRQLKNRPRDHALFVVGINSALRFRDLLHLRVSDVDGLTAGSSRLIRGYRITFNREMLASLKRLITLRNLSISDFLFTRASSRLRPLSYRSALALFKNWNSYITTPGHYGPSSLRKSFGYWQHRSGATDLESLRVLFGVKTTKQLIEYLGIEA